MFMNSLQLLKSNSQQISYRCYAGQPGKMLKKIMGHGKKKKFYAQEEIPILPSTSTFGKSSIESKITGNPRRSNVLNKLFMRHVTDIMATGEYSKELIGYGIEVNKVKVSQDYKFLRIYWIARTSEKHDEIEDLLQKNAGFLRRELSSLRVIGQVPHIVFVKDKDYFKLSELQDRLNKADYGDDFEPKDLAEHMKSEFQILTSLDRSVIEKLDKIEEPSRDDFSDIPVMPQNVLGLDHADILKRVKKGVSASKATHRSSDTQEWTKWSEFKTTQPENLDPVTFANHSEQRKAFKHFLLQRQLLQKKLHRMDKNWTADKEYLEEEFMERQMNRLDNRYDEEEDYLPEDTEELEKCDNDVK